MLKVPLGLHPQLAGKGRPDARAERLKPIIFVESGAEGITMAQCFTTFQFGRQPSKFPRGEQCTGSDWMTSVDT